MDTLEENNDELIVILINRGHKDAFEFIFKKHYKPLCIYLKHFIKRDDVIEQIVQDIFIRIWENRINFKPKGNIKSYLFRAAKNGSINYINHESVKNNAGENLKLIYYSDEQNIEKQFENDELLRLIDEGINLLPERCREVFLLVKFNGLTYKETARVLKISPKTVENQMGKALKALREFLLPSIK